MLIFEPLLLAKDTEVRFDPLLKSCWTDLKTKLLHSASRRIDWRNFFGLFS